MPVSCKNKKVTLESERYAADFFIYRGSEHCSVKNHCIAIRNELHACGVLLLWHIVGQGPAVLVKRCGTGGLLFIYFFSSRLSYLPFLMPHLLGDGWTY